MKSFLSCPVCWESLDGAPEPCEGCGTAYHERCLRLIGACAVPGCAVAEKALAPARPAWPVPAEARGTPQRYTETVSRLRANGTVLVPLVLSQMLATAWFLTQTTFASLVAYQVIGMLTLVWSTALAARPGDRPRNPAELLVTPLARMPRLIWAGFRMWFAVALPMAGAVGVGECLVPGLGFMAGFAWMAVAMFRLHLAPMLSLLPATEIGDPVSESWRLTGVAPGRLLRGYLGLGLSMLPAQIAAVLMMAIAGPATLLVMSTFAVALNVFVTTFMVVLVEDCRRALPPASPVSACGE